MTGLAAAFACFIAYLFTLPPAIYLGDSGEIATAAVTLGIAHPPGYPLSIILAKALMLILPGDPGFRMNVMAALAGAACVYVIYLAVIELIKFAMPKATNAGVPAALAALMYGFSPVFWFLSQNAKGFIYVTTHLVFMLSVLFLIRYAAKKTARDFYMSLYLASFLPVLHNTASLAVIFIFAALVFYAKDIVKKRLKISALLICVAALTPWIYLFIRASFGADMRFGGIATVPEVLSHISREVYNANETVAFSLNSFLFKLKNYTAQVMMSYFVAAVLAVFGAYALFKRNKKAAFFIMVFYALNIILLLYFTNNTFSPIFVYINKSFYLLPDMVLILLSGLGACYLAGLINEKFGLNRAFVTAMLFIAPLISLMSNYAANDNSLKFGGYDHAMNYLKTFRQGDILFSKSDAPTFNLLYARKILNKHPEITIYDADGNLFDLSVYEELRKNRNMTTAGMADIQLRMIRQTPGKVYLSMMYEFPQDNLKTTPYGIAYALTKNGEPLIGSRALMKLYSLRDYFRGGKLDNFYAETYGRYLVRLAEYAVINNDMRLFGIYEKAASPLIKEAPALLKVLATVYFYNLKDYPASLAYLEKAVTTDPYDYTTAELLIFLYAKAQRPEAEKWLEFYRSYQPDGARIRALLERIRQ